MLTIRLKRNKKNPAAAKPPAERSCLIARFHVKKNNVDNKTHFSYQKGYCLYSWALQYVVLRINPIHNSPFSIYPH